MNKHGALLVFENFGSMRAVGSISDTLASRMISAYFGHRRIKFLFNRKRGVDSFKLKDGIGSLDLLFGHRCADFSVGFFCPQAKNQATYLRVSKKAMNIYEKLNGGEKITDAELFHLIETAALFANVGLESAQKTEECSAKLDVFAVHKCLVVFSVLLIALAREGFSDKAVIDMSKCEDCVGVYITLYGVDQNTLERIKRRTAFSGHGLSLVRSGSTAVFGYMCELRNPSFIGLKLSCRKHKKTFTDVKTKPKCKI